MTMNPLPPQAYTKDTLLKAYQWLMLQNPSIKEMATTPDILVSLFLKATRDGEGALERPSIKNFKNELKSLAGIMGELDRTPGSPTQAPPPPPVQVMPNPSSIAAGTQTQVSYTEKTVTATTRAPDVLELLDPCSLAMIREVKEGFNLSEDLEALRMLIKIGHNRALGFLK